MSFDPAIQRKIFGRFATGITVVTARAGELLHGMTANAVSSLSLDPPLVLVAVDRRAAMHGILQSAGAYALNILAEDQQELSARFAKSGPKDLSDLELRTAVTGAPLLAGTLGWVDCQLAQVVPGGDHDLFIGEILAGEFADGRPLLYFAGQYRRLAD